MFTVCVAQPEQQREVRRYSPGIMPSTRRQFAEFDIERIQEPGLVGIEQFFLPK